MMNDISSNSRKFRKLRVWDETDSAHSWGSGFLSQQKISTISWNQPFKYFHHFSAKSPAIKSDSHDFAYFCKHILNFIERLHGPTFVLICFAKIQNKEGKKSSDAEKSLWKKLRKMARKFRLPSGSSTCPPEDNPQQQQQPPSTPQRSQNPDEDPDEFQHDQRNFTFT